MYKKLIILDIDETLIHTEEFPTDYLSVGTYDFKFQLSDSNNEYFTIKRPYLNDFLDYIFNNFDVAIWTAAGDIYAKHILTKIGINLKSLRFIYTSENCTIKMNNDTGQCYGVKTLSKIRKKFDLSQVLILDDISETAINNYSNLIKIKPFIFDRKDNELLKLISYLEKIKDAKDVRNIEKRGWDNN